MIKDIQKRIEILRDEAHKAHHAGLAAHGGLDERSPHEIVRRYLLGRADDEEARLERVEEEVSRRMDGYRPPETTHVCPSEEELAEEAEIDMPLRHAVEAACERAFHAEPPDDVDQMVDELARSIEGSGTAHAVRFRWAMDNEADRLASICEKLFAERYADDPLEPGCPICDKPICNCPHTRVPGFWR